MYGEECRPRFASMQRRSSSKGVVAFLRMCCSVQDSAQGFVMVGGKMRLVAFRLSAPGKKLLEISEIAIALVGK